MMKLALTIALILVSTVCTHSVASKEELISLKSLLRRLQKENPAPKPTPASAPAIDNGSHPEDWKGKTYKYDTKAGGPGISPIVQHAFPNSSHDWTKTRQAWYKAEGARIYAQRTFHTEELKRYMIQKELNEKRRAIETDNSKSIAQKYADLKVLDKEYELPIIRQDTEITRVQVLRNPKNVVEAQAEKDLRTEWANATAADKTALQKSVLDAPQARRMADAKLSAAETKMMQLWEDRFNKFKDQYELNFVFHKSEFVEFARDEQFLEDTRLNWEDKNHTIMSKDYRQRYLEHFYRKESGVIKNLINKNNQARNRAQGIKNNAEKAVANHWKQNYKTFLAKDKK